VVSGAFNLYLRRADSYYGTAGGKGNVYPSVSLDFTFELYRV